MNKKQAVAKGYRFTGHYSHDKEEQKQNALEIRKSGVKAIVVNIPTNPLSRGNHGMGYSVYAEQKYFDYQLLNDLKMLLTTFPSKITRLEEDFKESYIKIKESEQKTRDLIMELEKKYNKKQNSQKENCHGKKTDESTIEF